MLLYLLAAILVIAGLVLIGRALLCSYEVLNKSINLIEHDSLTDEEINLAIREMRERRIKGEVLMIYGALLILLSLVIFIFALVVQKAGS